MEIINPDPNLPLNFHFSPLDLHLLLSSLHRRRRLRNYVLAKLRKRVCWEELLEGAALCELPEALKVACILVHGDMDYAVKNRNNLIFTFKALFEFDIFVPEGVGKEVEADAVRATFKKSAKDG